jgi:hypothetical protein
MHHVETRQETAQFQTENCAKACRQQEIATG